MTDKELKVNNRIQKSRFIEKYERYSDDFIESATIRPEKYHVLEQIDNEDCIITTLHQIINSDYLDVERELINEKLLSSNNYESHVFNEYNVSKQSNLSEELNESSFEDDNKEYSDTDVSLYDEDDENNSEELLLLLRNTEKSKRFQRNENLSLPSSDFLIVKNFPISFGIPIVTLQKLNIKPIMFIWLMLLLYLIYGTSVFLDEYIINDIIPLYPLNNIFDNNKENNNLMSSFLRSKNSTLIKSSSYYNYGKKNILKKLFPSLIDDSENISEYDKPLNITLDIKHCHVQFLNSTSDLSYVKIRSWRLFSQSHLYSGSNGRYRISKNKKAKYEYICSHHIFFWILKRYLLPWKNYNDINIKDISWKNYKEYCDSSSRPWNFFNESNLLIKLHQSNFDDYFQCSINFFLSNNFVFNDISIKFIPSSSYMKVSSNIPIYANSAFHLEALHGIFDLKEIHSPNISITLSDGWTSFDIPKYKDNINRYILIESRGAPIYINSKIPLIATMPTRIAELSIFRSKYLNVQLDHKFKGFNGSNYYKSDTVIANLNTDSSFYDNRITNQYYTKVTIQGSTPPIYINVNNDELNDQLMTWAGKIQWKDPHLLRFSKARFENFSKWLQEDLASPWVLYINILGNNDYPKGNWKAVSSRAFIRDAYGLVLLSGGLLSPRVYNLFIHILGLKCLVPINHSDLEDLDVINIDVNHNTVNDNHHNLGDNTFKNNININETNDFELEKKENLFSNITKKFNLYPNKKELNSKEKMKFINLKNIFNNTYLPKILSNNLQESFYFDNNINDDYYNQNFNVHDDSLNIRDISDVGNYIGKSSNLKSCESSITENIFSVINSAITNTAQQPNVIVWTQNENIQPNIILNIDNLNTYNLNNWFIVKIKNKLKYIFKMTSLIFQSIENFIFPSWIIPGWNNLSKKMLKSSLLADDDFILNPDTLRNNYQKNIEQFIYTAENDAILRDLVTANDLQGYIISLLLNITCAILVAAVAMWILYYYVFPWFLTGIREMQLVSTASHRLNHDFRTSEAAEWIVMVSTIQWPTFGLLLRWNQRQKRRDNEKLCIYIKQVEKNDDLNNNPSEFFLYIPANEASLTTHLGRNQQELFVPMKYTDKCIFEVTMPYELISDHKYRLRILRISSSGHIIEQSNWSNEIIPGNKMKFVDFPLLFLRRFLPKKRSSLNLFIDKNTNHYSSFGIPFHFKDIEIIIFDVLGGKKKKKDTFNEFEDDQDDNMIINQFKKTNSDITDKKLNNFLNSNLNKLNNESDKIKSFGSYVYNDNITGFGNNYNEMNRKYKYLLVAKLVRDSAFNDNTANGISGIVNNDYDSGNGNLRNFNSRSISEDDNFESLKNYTFKNKSFDLDKIRIEGNLENINLYDNIMGDFDKSAVGSGNNIYILRNKMNISNNEKDNNEDNDFDNNNNSLYLEQSLISQKRIVFELQEADSGQVIANGDIKCSKLIDIAWKSLINGSDYDNNSRNDILNNDTEKNKAHLGSTIKRNIRTKNKNNKGLLDSHLIQVHDTISNNTISINKFVDVSIKLYYVEGGQWGELSMLLDRSFWVQYLRHDLSPDIIIDLGSLNNIESLNIEMITNNNIEEKEIDNLNNQDHNSIINRINYDKENTSKPRFIYDTPGKIVINGSDIQIKWIWKESKKNSLNYIPKKLYLHLFDHCTDTHLTSLHGERSIPNTGTYAWSVDVPFISQRSSSRDVYIVMAVSKEDIPSNVIIKGKMFSPRNSVLNLNNNRKNSIYNKQLIVAVSNSFTIIRLTTLSEFELLYATFCRTYGLEMEVVTYNDLSKYGFLVSSNSLRVCNNIRKPIPTETHQDGTYCPGQYIISAKALAVVSDNICGLKNQYKEPENCIFLKSQRKSVDIIENCTLNYSTYWWSSSPDRFLLKNGIILDTSIFLPITIKIISYLKIDSIMLFIRNFSITRAFNFINNLKKKLKIFDKTDNKFHLDLNNQDEVKTINISSGLLVHSNYSTVFRRKSTWRSTKFKTWKAILNFITNKDNSKLLKRRSKDNQNISKSKQRWSNALLSLKIAHLKHSPSLLIKNLKNGNNHSSIDYSTSSIKNNNFDYVELATISNVNNDETQLPLEDNLNINTDQKYSHISGYNIGYGGILVPIYIAKIKQRQEIIHEIWYFIQFSILPVLLNGLIYSFQISLLSIFPITCIILTLIYNYLSTLSITTPHLQISSRYISDIVFNPTWNFFMSIPFPIPYLILSAILHLLIINITFIASNSYSRSYRFHNRNDNNSGFSLLNKMNYYWFKLLMIFEDIGMFITIFSTFLTLLAISMFFLWFLLGSLINSDNILPYVVMLLALGFVIVSLWNNFSSSRGIVDRFIAENLQSLISIALGHWFEATNQTFTNNSNSTDPNDIIAAASEQLHSEITNYRYIWAKSMLNNNINNDNKSHLIKSQTKKQLLKDYLDGSMELHHSTKIKSLSSNIINDYSSVYCSKWEYLKINPVNPKNLFGINDHGELIEVQDTLKMYYGMRLATKKDVLTENDKVDSLLEGFDVALLQDGIKYGPRFGYKVDSLQNDTWYKCAIVKVPIFPPSESLPDEAKVKLIFDFFDMDRDGFLNREEFLYWVVNLHYDRFFFNGINTKYNEIVDYFNSICNTNVDDKIGFTVDDIIILYSLYPGNLDSDYEKVIPIRNLNENEISGNASLDQFQFDKDDRYILDNNVNEEEYDDEFNDDLFILNSNSVSNKIANIDQKGYLWLDLLSINNKSYSISNENTNNFYIGQIDDSDIGVIIGDLNNLKLCSLSQINKLNNNTNHLLYNDNINDLNIDNHSSLLSKNQNRNNKINIKGDLNTSKYTKSQLLRELNVQKLKYIFTFATRNLRTPDIETALKDIHSLAYKVFDAQIALLAPIFGKKNVLSFSNNSISDDIVTFNNVINNNIDDNNNTNTNDLKNNTNYYYEDYSLNNSLSIMDKKANYSGLSNRYLSLSSSNWVLNSTINSNKNLINKNENNDNDTTKFLQLMRILHNEIRQDIWLLFNHIISRLFNKGRVRKGANYFLDIVYPKLIRRKAARIVNIFYGPSLNELSPSIHDYFISAPPKTAAQVVDALKEYRVENQTNVRETLEIISLSQGNASMQFQVSLITKALYALSVLKDTDVEMLTVDIPWKRSHSLITEEVLILPRNHQGMKVVLGAIQTVLRRATSITSNKSGILISENSYTNVNNETNINDQNEKRKDLEIFQNTIFDSKLNEFNNISNNNTNNVINEFTETTLEQIIQVIVSQYLWMDAFIFLIRLCGINLSTDRLPTVTYDNSVSLTNLNYVEEKNLQHVKHIFTKLSNGSGFLPVELSDLALQTLTDKCLNFPGLLVSMHFLGLISNNMFLMGIGSPMNRLKELGLNQNINVLHIHKNTNFNNILSNIMDLSELSNLNKNDKNIENLFWNMNENNDISDLNNFQSENNDNNNNNNNNNNNTNSDNLLNKLIPEKCSNYGELLDWTLLNSIKGIPDDIIKDFRRIAVLRCGFIGRSQLHDYIRYHKRLYMNNIESNDINEIEKNRFLPFSRSQSNNYKNLNNSNLNTNNNDNFDDINQEDSQNDVFHKSQDDYFEKMTGKSINSLEFNISFDIFDTTLTTLGFSNHKLQSYILWLLLCLNLKMNNVQPFLNASHVRDFIIMVYLQPIYKNSDEDINNNQSNSKKISTDNNNCRNINSNKSNIQNSNNKNSHRSSIFDINIQNKHFDAQDVHSYQGYFTREMLRRFLALAKITIPNHGVEAIWRSLPKDPLNITSFIAPFRSDEEENYNDSNTYEDDTYFSDEFDNDLKDDNDNNIKNKLVNNSRRKIIRRKSIGGKFKKDKKSDDKFHENIENTNYNDIKYKKRNQSKESVHLRILMDPTGMDPTEGVVINIDSVRRLLPKKLMTGLWPEAIKVVLNIGLHLEKPESSIIEATSKCLECSNKYGLIKPGDMVSILAALSKEGLSFDLLCELLNNMRIQLPVREVKRMFDLMDLNQDKSLDLQELLDGFEVLFGLFLPQLVHVHVGLSYERQGLIIMAASASLLLFCAFVGIAIKTFEGMRNELSTAVQSVLAIVGAVGLQTGASQDSKEIEERMKERIEDIMGGEIETSISQVELNENSKFSSNSDRVIILNNNNNNSRVITRNKNVGINTNNYNNNNLMILTEKGPILKIGYSLPSKYRSDINDPRPCITFYIQDQVYLEPLFYCTKGIINQQHNLFAASNINKRWCIKPSLPKYIGLTFSTETGIIHGTIPTHSQNKIGYIKRVSALDNEKFSFIIKNSINTNSTKLQRKPSNIKIFNETDLNKYKFEMNDTNDINKNKMMRKTSSFSSKINEDIFDSEQDNGIDQFTKELLGNKHQENVLIPYVGQLVQMNRKTFTVYCIITEFDEKIVFKTRVTFQIIPRTRIQNN